MKKYITQMRAVLSAAFLFFATLSFSQSKTVTGKSG